VEKQSQVLNYMQGENLELRTEYRGLREARKSSDES